MPYYGTGLGAGGAAASGLQSGFELGLRADAAASARQQQSLENQRQATNDQQRANQVTRTNAQQDEDRQLSGASAMVDGHNRQLAALAVENGGWDKVPEADANRVIAARAPYLKQVQDIYKNRAGQITEPKQQWAQNLVSRLQAGQVDWGTLPPTDKADLVEVQCGLPITAFVRDPKTGESQVSQGVKDGTAGLQTQNMDLACRALNALVPQEIRKSVGHTAPNGAQITDAKVAALVPSPQQAAPPGAPAQPQQSPVQGLAAALGAATAPPGGTGLGAPPSPDSPAPAGAMPDNTQPPAPAGAPGAPAPQDVAQVTAPQQALAPGTNSDLLMPVLKVTAEHPDGTEQTYPAPMTSDRSTGADETVLPGFSMSKAVDRMGALGTMQAWADSAEGQQVLAQTVKDRNGAPSSFLQAYAAGHGDMKALAPPEDKGGWAERARSINKSDLDPEKKQSALRVLFGLEAKAVADKPATGVAGTLAAIKGSGLDDADKAKAERIALKVDAAPKADTSKGTGLGTGAAENLTGDALLATLDANDQATVKGLIDGSIKPETISIRNNSRQNMVALASRVAQGNGGSMNTSTAAVNAGTEKAFAYGAQSKTIRAMNTAVDHLATLRKLATALNNNDVKGINALKNTIADQFGDVDVSNFDAAKQIVADEVIKAVVASGGSIGGALADRTQAEAQVSRAKSPGALAGVIDTFTKLMGGQINSLGQQYVSGGGTHDFTSFLTPGTKSLYHGPQSAARSGTGIGNPGKVSPADQTARDSDAGRIMREELTTEQGRLAAATDPAAKARSQDSIAAIQREITKLPATKVGTGLGAAPAPTAKPAAAAGVQTATNPKTGEKLQLMNGQWVPLK